MQDIFLMEDSLALGAYVPAPRQISPLAYCKKYRELLLEPSSQKEDR